MAIKTFLKCANISCKRVLKESFCRKYF